MTDQPRAHPDASVMVVGAGLAGLSAAVTLHRAGRRVTVLEAADRPGGRMATDVVDGFLVDRGFQVLNSAYPELQRLSLLPASSISEFRSGALVHRGGRRHRIEDPRSAPLSVPSAVRAPIGSLRQKLALVALLARDGFGPVTTLKRQDDRPFRQALAERHLAGDVTDRFIRPFLAGVLLEDALETSTRYVDLVWRTFVRGTVFVPTGGMGQFPAALAALLPPDAIRYGCRVRAVGPGRVETDEGVLTADEVVVAADPVTAAGLLGRPAPPMHGVTTFWHAAASSPGTVPLLLLDSEGGPVVNSVVMSAVSQHYSPDDRALIASSVLGVGRLTESEVRRELARMWGTDTSRWETVAVSEVRAATPAFPAGSPFRRKVRSAPGLLVAGDWRDTPSTQGALVSGRRAAEEILRVV